MKYMIKADLKGSEALGALNMIQEAGEEVALGALIERHKDLNNELLDLRPWEDFEEVYGEHEEYVMACRRTEGQVILVKVVSESSHTPGPWAGLEPDPDNYGEYRLREAAKDQSKAMCQAEYRIAAEQNTGNARLMTAASNVFMKAAEDLGVDAVDLAERLEKAERARIRELFAFFIAFS